MHRLASVGTGAGGDAECDHEDYCRHLVFNPAPLAPCEDRDLFRFKLIVLE